MKEISISDTSVEEGWVLTGPQSPLRYSKEAREKRPTFIGSNKELFPAKCLWLSPLLSSASVFRGSPGCSPALFILWSCCHLLAVFLTHFNFPLYFPLFSTIPNSILPPSLVRNPMYFLDGLLVPPIMYLFNIYVCSGKFMVLPSRVSYINGFALQSQSVFYSFTQTYVFKICL